MKIRPGLPISVIAIVSVVATVMGPVPSAHAEVPEQGRIVGSGAGGSFTLEWDPFAFPPPSSTTCTNYAFILTTNVNQPVSRVNLSANVSPGLGNDIVFDQDYFNIPAKGQKELVMTICPPSYWKTAEFSVGVIGAGNSVLADGISVLRLQRLFSDVPSTRAFFAEISWLADREITGGYSDGTFRPLDSVNRDAMAAFLYRFAGRPTFTPPAQSPFSDVTPSTPFYKEITWLASTGITGGYSDGTFRPLEPVNRDAMAAFLYRFAGAPQFTPPSSSPFSDVSTQRAFYREIAWLSQTGVTGGYSNGTFRPVLAVSRDAMAAFLFRFEDKGLVL